MVEPSVNLQTHITFIIIMRGPILKEVPSLSATHFMLDGIPTEVYRRTIACNAEEDGSLSNRSRVSMFESIKQTVNISNVPVERTVVEYTITFDPTKNVWFAECYL